MSVPKALQFATSSFPISRNTFKLQPYSTASANAGDQIQISLPANSIVALDTLSVFGTINATATTFPVGLPTNVESFIDSAYWTANGQQISNSFNLYGVLANAFLDWQGGDKINMRKVQQLGAPVAAAPAAAAAFATPVVWNNWLGLPSSSTTKYIDTSLIGDLRLHIRLAPNLVLTSTAATAAPSYNVSNLYAFIDVVSVDDGGLYQSLLQKRLESGPLEVAFTDFYTFNCGGFPTGGASTNRFSVASSSLDYVHATALPYNYTNTGAVGWSATTGNSMYFQRGFPSLTYNTATPATDFKSSVVTLNNVQYPASGPLLLNEAWNQTAIALGEHNNLIGQTNPLMTTIPLYLNNFFWHTTRFNSPGDASEHSVRTGQDTRGNAAWGTWQVDVPGGTNAFAYTAVVFVQVTKVWAIGAGRQSQITA